MQRNPIDKAPFLLIAIVIIAAFFLSCTKKPQEAANNAKAANGRVPASNFYTTPHGFKVQFEPAETAPQKK